MAKVKMCNSRLFLPSTLKIFIVSDELRRWGGRWKKRVVDTKAQRKGDETADHFRYDAPGPSGSSTKLRM
jgi:hypothetical protein